MHLFSVECAEKVMTQLALLYWNDRNFLKSNIARWKLCLDFQMSFLAVNSSLLAHQ